MRDGVRAMWYSWPPFTATHNHARSRLRTAAPCHTLSARMNPLEVTAQEITSQEPGQPAPEMRSRSRSANGPQGESCSVTHVSRIGRFEGRVSDERPDAGWRYDVQVMRKALLPLNHPGTPPVRIFGRRVGLRSRMLCA